VLPSRSNRNSNDRASQGFSARKARKGTESKKTKLEKNAPTRTENGNPSDNNK